MSITFTPATLVADESGIAYEPINLRCTHPCTEPTTCPEGGRYCDHMFHAREACHLCNIGINMSNANARPIIEALGYTDDEDMYCGSATIDDLRGRALLAIALAPYDEGMPSYEAQPGEHVFAGARMIQCARPEGYLQTRLQQILDLTDEYPAATHIVWH